MTAIRTRSVVFMVVLVPLTVVAAYLVGVLWWLRLSDRLVGEPDAEGLLVLAALLASAVTVLKFLIVGVGVATKSINARWFAAPAVLLAATALGLCGVDLGKV